MQGTNKNPQSPKKPATVRIAVWSARHRWLVVIGWFGIVAALVATMSAIGTKTRGFASQGLPVTEAGQANEIYKAAGATEPDNLILLFNHPTLRVSDPAYQSVVQEAAQKMRMVSYNDNGTSRPAFNFVMDYYSSKNPALASADGTTTRIVAPIVGAFDESSPKYKAAKPVIADLKAQHTNFTIYVFNNAAATEEFSAIINHDLDNSAKITLPLTFLILLIAFGALVAALVPLVLAASALMATFGLVAIYSHLVSRVDSSASQVIVLLGLAVGVDYSLFMITRYRQELRRGHTKLAAIEIASSTAGRAIFFSGVTVMISLAGLFIVNDALFSSIASGTIIVVLISVIGSLTFLPASLSILGKGINWGRLPYFGKDRMEGTGIWSRIVHGVMRRPIVFTVLISGLLLVLSVPVLHLHLGNTGANVTSLPAGMEYRDAALLMQDKWPQGAVYKLEVVLQAGQVNRTELQAAIQKFNAAALQLKGLSGPAEVNTAPNGQVIKLAFTQAGRFDSQENKDLVGKVRSELVPAYFKTLPGVDVYVTGRTAVVMDMVNHYTEVLPLIFAFVLSLSFILLLVAFHSIVIPVKAILLNLLSTGAAYGAVILVFQDGYLSDQLNFISGGVIESFLPAFLFTILFGLSMDYHLFVLTRIKEEKDKGAASVEAVARGISVTSGTITSAAAIMVMVFAVFVTLRLMVIRQLGLGLAVAVFIDATLIRCVLLPSTMKLLGDLNWYMPPFLRWVPRVTIEAGLKEDEGAENGGRGREKEEVLAHS